MSKLKIKWNSERLLSLSAMTISFITLLIFVYQTNLMRKQNSLSILPYLMLGTTNDSANSTFELNLKNHGVGPAIIESATMYYNDEAYQLSDYEDNLQQFLIILDPAFDSLEVFSFATLNKGLAIPAETTYNLLRVTDSSKDYALVTNALQRLIEEGLNYEIVYKSIQNERWLIREDIDEPERLD